jgi:hypothetical protein
LNYLGFKHNFKHLLAKSLGVLVEFFLTRRFTTFGKRGSFKKWLMTP